MIATFKSIFDLLKAFPDEQTCITHLEKLRWNGNVVSPFDETSKVYKCAGNKYRCKNTKKYFNVRTATIFEDTKLPLQKWFMALYVFSSHKKGISSHQLAKDISITQKSAWFVLHRLRYAFDNPAFKAVVGDGGNIVEADETFVGGKNKNKHKSKQIKNATGGKGKTIVFGAIERGGRLSARIIKDVSAESLKLALSQTVKEGSIVITDEWQGYKSITDKYFHGSVKHSLGEYVRGQIHSNSIECAWSHFKRGVYGIYHHVSDPHLQSYVDEFSLRYNTRTFETSNRFDLILANVAGKRLTYEKLISRT